jgi:hypothetical protein
MPPSYFQRCQARSRASLAGAEDARSPVNGPDRVRGDAPTVFTPPARPGVNAGPKTASRRNARQRASAADLPPGMAVLTHGMSSEQKQKPACV